MPEDARSRLERFMRKHNPEKIGTIDAILKAYSGREEQMFEALVRKYGPEPSQNELPAAVSAPLKTEVVSAVDPEKPEDARSRLERFMRKHNPEKIGTIDAILKAYSGREEQMFEALVRKYGPEPSQDELPAAVSAPLKTEVVSAVDPEKPEDARSRLERFMRKHNPEKIGTIDAILKAYSGREEQMFEALVRKYGPEPSQNELPAAVSAPLKTEVVSAVDPEKPEDARSRLERFMRKHNPEKIGTIDAILKAYSGREEQMFEALVRKYGPEPSQNELPAAVSAPLKTEVVSAVDPEKPEDVRSRLERFMRKHNPEKIGTIDAILKAYSGREEQMFEALVRKYGPEPPQEESYFLAGQKLPLSGVEDVSRLRVEGISRKNVIEKILCVAKASYEDVLLALWGKNRGLFVAKNELPTAVSATAAAPFAVDPEKPEDARSRLERFMRKHNPEKIGTIDAILKAYSGREEQMFEALVRKYGPEPPREELPTAVSAPLKTEVVSPSVGVTALRARLTRLFTMYAPEKLCGVDALIEAAGPNGMNKLIHSLVAMYGPEPAEDCETGDNRSGEDGNTTKEPNSNGGDDNDSRDERQQLINWLADTGRDAESMCYTLMSEEQLLYFVRTTFGDYENRLRRLFVRYDPPRLQEVTSLLATHNGHEEELIAQLTQVLGPEPARSAPTVLTRLVSRRRVDADRSRIDEETWSDDEDNNNNNNTGGGNDKGDRARHLPKSLVDGHALIDAYSANESADFSGDEAAAHPRDEEYWYRLFVHSCEDATHADKDNDDDYEENSSRTQCAPAKNEGSPANRAEAVPPPSTATPTGGQRSLDSPPPAELHRKGGGTLRLRVTLGNKFGQAIGTLCTACGENVAQSFEALWQPVGPQYLQLFSETVVKDGYLEKLSPDSRRMGVKWQKRYFRVNDKGMHYYETNATSEKPKGYKVFTRNSVVLGSVDASAHPSCTDGRYHYFAVTVNESNDVFYLRTPSEEEKRQWISFLQLALARMRLTTVGHDQNPSRWRARMAGMKEADIALIDLAEVSATVLQKLEQKHEELQERIRSERAQRELMVTQVSEMQKQQDLLTQRIHEAKEQARLAEEDADMKCAQLAERAASIKQRRLDMKNNLEEARRSINGITHSVIKLQSDIVDMESECKTREAQLRHVYDKWRRCEERRAAEKGAVYRSCSS